MKWRTNDLGDLDSNYVAITMVLYFPPFQRHTKLKRGSKLFQIPNNASNKPKKGRKTRTSRLASIPALYKTNPNPARATATRPDVTFNPAAPLPEPELLEAVAPREEASVPDPVAMPV